MNQIDKIRKKIKDSFDPNQLVKDSQKKFRSPNKQYRLETSNHWLETDGVSGYTAKVEVYESNSKERIFNFFGNYRRFFHQWLTKDGIEYLICAEDLFGGQTILDLTNRKMESFSPEGDGFIWMDFHLSPDGKMLATIGCHWGCSYVIKIYDFRTPLILPLKELNEIALLDPDEIITGWLDNETIKVKDIEREEEMEKQGKMESETPVEREIKVLKHKV